MKTEIWHGCYDASWKGLISPASFGHPAKMSRALIVRIFDRLFEMGALTRGDLICDPFGGIGTTGIESAARGLRCVCCELEPRFVELARQNFDGYRSQCEGMLWPVPVMVQGDSRRLREHIGPVLAAGIVSSPPYVGITTVAGGLNTLPAADGQQGGRSAVSPSQDTDPRYGGSAGQLSRFPEGSVSAVVSSPPFASGDSASAQSITTRSDKSAAWIKQNTGSACTQGYGVSEGQLGLMPMTDTFWGAAKAIVSECHAILKPGAYAVWVVKSYVKDKAIVDFPSDWRKLCEAVGFETVLEVRAMLVEETQSETLFG
jgi:tRNA G10  N-methylase Trm11